MQLCFIPVDTGVRSPVALVALVACQLVEPSAGVGGVEGVGKLRWPMQSGLMPFGSRKDTTPTLLTKMHTANPPLQRLMTERTEDTTRTGEERRRVMTQGGGLVSGGGRRIKV